MSDNKNKYSSPLAGDEKGKDVIEGEVFSTPLDRTRQISNVNPGETDEISLKELILKVRGLWRYLLSKWMLIVLSGVFGGLIGLGYAFYKKPVYTATTTFVLESGDGGGSGMGQYAGLASMVGIDLGGGGGGIFQGDNIFELYKSRTMIEKTLLSEIEYNGHKQLIIDYYIDFNQLRKAWKREAGLAGIKFNQEKTNSRVQDSILGKVVSDIKENYLSVSKPNKLLSIIKVDVSSTDEFFAKSFNDLIVKNVNDFYVQTKTKKSLDNVAILQQKTDSVRLVMNGAIYSSAAISDATPNLNLTRQVQRMAPMQRSQFTAETNKAILGELVKNLEMSKMTLLKEAPLLQVVDKPVLPLKKERLGMYKGFLIGGLVNGVLVIFLLISRRVLKGVMA